MCLTKSSTSNRRVRQDKILYPLKTRKDAKIQRTICRLIQTSFGVFGVFRGSDSLSPLFCSVGIFFDLNGQDGIVGPAAIAGNWKSKFAYTTPKTRHICASLDPY